MGNRIRIKAELPDCSLCLAVVGVVDSVGQQELRFALRALSFYRDDHRGANKDAVVLLLGDYDAAFFNAEALAQLCGYNDRAALSHPCRLHSFNRDH